MLPGWLAAAGALALGAGLARRSVLSPSGAEGGSRRYESAGGRQPSILVTGAGSGIGLATARLFSEAGWFVGAFDIDEAALARHFAQRGAHECVAARLDVTDAASCAAAVALMTARAPGGEIDVLFNCAGLLAIGTFAAMPLAQQLAQVRVNVDGVVTLTHAALAALKRSKGCIVNMASLSAVGGVPMFAVYSSTKCFVASFTEALRSELAGDGVRVCDVSAPFVSTPMTASQSYDAKLWSDKRDFLKPEEVAGTVWRAVHSSSFYNEHFYVDQRTRLAFRLVWLSRLLGLGLHTRTLYNTLGRPTLPPLPSNM
jgi:NAD(P)-dependent dehydrogenase (short-subunit alcohol dehydrogenase family)